MFAWGDGVVPQTSVKMAGISAIFELDISSQGPEDKNMLQ
jgi:hypothetical protein